MKIAFRTDSSSSMGSGHVTRCLTLANELRYHGADILFICREHPGHLIRKLKECHFSVCILPKPTHLFLSTDDDYAAWRGVTVEQDAQETLAALEDQAYDWFVIDHYGLGQSWETQVRKRVKNILVIDDLANRDHDCDILLDQNYFCGSTESRYTGRVPSACKLLLGPHYALLQPEYAQLRALMPERDGQVCRVLVFFGGSDLSNQTAKVLVALSYPHLTHLAVDVVIGTNHPDFKGIVSMAAGRLRTMIHQDLPSLAGLMARADLFIGAGGSTTWERMSLGVPSLVISVAENQKESTHILAVEGYQQLLSREEMASPLEWHNTIVQLLKEPSVVRKISQKAKKIVDGQGARRLARLMFGTKGLNIKIRHACLDDEALILEWANDRDAREQSFHQNRISEHEHARWFAEKINDPDCIFFVAEDQTGLPVGQVRFDINRIQAEALISISLDRSLRGFGLSQQLLSKALEKFRSVELNIKIIAEVRDENWPSQQLFTTLQFISVPSRRINSKAFELAV